MNIRPYRPGDEASVIRLWTECDLVRPWNDPRGFEMYSVLMW